jgi:hypothetical protein
LTAMFSGLCQQIQGNNICTMDKQMVITTATKAFSH